MDIKNKNREVVKKKLEPSLISFKPNFKFENDLDVKRKKELDLAKKKKGMYYKKIIRNDDEPIKIPNSEKTLFEIENINSRKIWIKDKALEVNEKMKFIQKNHKIHRIIILKKISYKLKLRVKGQDIKN